ncbi:hypothetical protein AgCh_017031 [Apium graveolens]
MDAKFLHFSSESRNVRLGVATDGFIPFHKMNATHNTWPIPLIEELKELWETGVETYDAATNQVFMLCASVQWTISDFPGYTMLLGWSTKGKLACPVCHYETSLMYLKYSKKVWYMNHRKFLDTNHKWRSEKRRFNGEVEAGTSALMLTGRQVTEILDGYENSFGGVGRKRKVSCNINPWNKSKGSLKPEVAVPLIRLGEFLRVHLCLEIEYGGPVHQRWMYSIERYLGVLKKYVRNKSKPKGSIVEGYLTDECLTFRARFLNDGENKSMNEAPTSNAEKGGYPIGLGKSKTRKDINLLEDTWTHQYILFNYDNKEVEDLIEMDSDKVTIRLHHMGNFMKTRYVGDKCEVYDVERDYFSYSVLMKFVKDLKYDEIGGVYIKQRGWKLVTNDRGVTEFINGRREVDFYLDNIIDPDVPPVKQMQSHNMNAEKERSSVVVRKKPQYSQEDVNRETVEPSPKDVVNDVDGSGTGVRQAGLVESGGSKEMVKPVEGEGCNEYEMRRNKNIAKNKEKFAALGLVQTKSASEKAKKKLKQANEDAGESDYLPSNDPARESENEEDENVTSKTTRQRVIPGSTTGGPRTRGQAAKLVDNSQNKETTLESLPAEETSKRNVEARKKVREPHTTGPRTFAQVRSNLLLEKVDKLPIGIDDDEAEELLKISDADVYLEIRKRDTKRKYKIPDEMDDEVNEKTAKVQKVLQTEGAEAANKLVHGDKERTPSYLIGRLAEIEKEVDDKLELKFRDMMKKLADQNPGLKISLDESETKAAAESDKSPEAS